MREDWGREHKMEQKNPPKRVSLLQPLPSSPNIPAERSPAPQAQLAPSSPEPSQITPRDPGYVPTPFPLTHTISMPPKEQRVKRKRSNLGGAQSSLANWVVSEKGNTDVKTDNTTDRKTELPTGGQTKEFDNTVRIKCMITREGHCTTHDSGTREVTVNNSKWKDRGNGRGYGYVNTKVKKFICMRRNEAPAVPKIAPSRLDLSSANPGGITREVRVRVSVESENKIISAKEEV